MPYYALEIAPSALPLWLLDEHARADRCDPHKMVLLDWISSRGEHPSFDHPGGDIAMDANPEPDGAGEFACAVTPPQRRWRVSRLPRDHHLARVPKREVTPTLWYACSGDAPTTDGAWVQE